MRNELAETFDHLGQAASHGISGVGAAVAPRMSAMAPRMIAARNLALKTSARAAVRLATRPMRARRKKERMMARKRHTYQIASLLAIGAAMGAAGALMDRRRRRSVWQEYDASQEPTQAVQPVPEPTVVAPGPGPAQGATSVGSLADQYRSSLNAPEDSAFDEVVDYETDAIPPIYEPSRERSS